MQKNPHQLIEGCAIAAFAVGATYAFIFIRGEYWEIADILDRAVAEAYEAGFLGTNLFDTGQRIELIVHRGAGAYICGEETALLDALEGKRGNPRLKPPFPAVQGLYGGPTLINNVETLSNLPHIVTHGADWFKSFGTEQSPGPRWSRSRAASSDPATTRSSSGSRRASSSTASPAARPPGGG